MTDRNHTPRFKKYLRQRINISLYQKLCKAPEFLNEPDAIMAAFYLLVTIARFNLRSEAEGRSHSNLQAKHIKSLFRKYTQTRYLVFLEALESLGLLERPKPYCAAKGTGSTKGHRLTDVGRDLLSSSEKEYFLKLVAADEEVLAGIDALREEDSRTTYCYSDRTRDYLVAKLLNLTWDNDYILFLLDELPLSAEGRQHAFTSINNLQSSALRYWPYKKGRVYTEWACLKSEFRQAATYVDPNGNRYTRQATIDIRSCHPTFFGSFVFDIYKQRKNYFAKRAVLPAAIQAEKQKWIAFFTHDANPRQQIALDTNLRADDIKEHLNCFINGGKDCPRLEKWFAAQYPQLNIVFQNIRPKLRDKERDKDLNTCDWITENYEGPLMQDFDVFELARKLDIFLLPEHDGYSILALEDDKDVLEKAAKLEAYLKNTARSKFGVPVVCTVKSTEKISSILQLPEAVKAIHELKLNYVTPDQINFLRDYLIAQDKCDAARAKMGKSIKSRNTFKIWREKRDKLKGVLTRCE
jgi:hypothetical protein